MPRQDYEDGMCSGSLGSVLLIAKMWEPTRIFKAVLFLAFYFSLQHFKTTSDILTLQSLKPYKLSFSKEANLQDKMQFPIASLGLFFAVIGSAIAAPAPEGVARRNT